MGSIELEREINSLKGDLNMTKMAVMNVQSEMKRQLSGEMGEDITAVLNGERVIEAGYFEKKKFKIKSWFRRLFRMF